MQPILLGRRLTTLTCCSAVIGLMLSSGGYQVNLRQTLQAVSTGYTTDATDDDRGSGRLLINPVGDQLNHQSSVPASTPAYRGSGRAEPVVPSSTSSLTLSWRGSGRLGQDGDTA